MNPKQWALLRYPQGHQHTSLMSLPVLLYGMKSIVKGTNDLDTIRFDNRGFQGVTTFKGQKLICGCTDDTNVISKSSLFGWILSRFCQK